MVLLEEYYELNENENVSKWWKIMQIFFYICAGILGIWSGFAMFLAKQAFDEKCYLSAEIVLQNVENPNENSHLNFDSTQTKWGADSLCEYCQYSMISSFIFAVIWGTFFLMCGKGGKTISGLPQPWRIVFPSLIFNFIYLIIAFVSTVLVHDGTDTFCRTLDIEAKTQNCKGVEILIVNNTDFALRMLDTVIKTSWATTAAWLCAFLLPLFRIIFVIDFSLIKVCVYKIEEAVETKQEEIVQVTNYEEPNRLPKETVDEGTEIDEEMKKFFTAPKKEKKKRKVQIKKEYLPRDSDESPILEKKASTGEIFYVKADIEHDGNEEEFEDEIIEPRVQTLDEKSTGNVVKRNKRPKL